MTIMNGMNINYKGVDYGSWVVTPTKASLRFGDYGFVPVIETDRVTLPGLIMGEDAQHLGSWLVHFLQTIGVSSWEQVPGTPFVVLFRDGVARGVAGLTNDEVMIWETWAEGLTT